MYWLSRNASLAKRAWRRRWERRFTHPSRTCSTWTSPGETAATPAGSPSLRRAFSRRDGTRKKPSFMAHPVVPIGKTPSGAKQKNSNAAASFSSSITSARSIWVTSRSPGLWRHLQSLTIAVEGELVTSDGRLMGRLDLLFADVDDSGELTGWLVADLKTGNAPTEVLKPEVNRQLRMYRDILLANNPAAPPVRTEGWYTKTATSGQPREEACSRTLTQHGMPRSRPRCQWTLPRARTVAVGFATGKLGVPTGGHGARNRARSTRISATLLFFSIATNPPLVQRFSNCASRWTAPGAPYRPGTNFPPDLTVEERRPSRRCKEGHQGPLFLPRLGHDRARIVACRAVVRCFAMGAVCRRRALRTPVFMNEDAP